MRLRRPSRSGGAELPPPTPPPTDVVDHRPTVLRLGEGGDAIWVVTCTCNVASPPHATRLAAMRWARLHSPTVVPTLTIVSDEEVDEAGSGWQCMFCGATVKQSPVRIHLHWTDDGVDGEQWYAAHRSCLAQRMSTDEALAPLFTPPSPTDPEPAP